MLCEGATEIMGSESKANALQCVVDDFLAHVAVQSCTATAFANLREYGMSQSRRAMIECIFGWGKQHGTMRKTKHRGICGVTADFMLNLIAYNLIRIPKLIAA